MTIPPFYFPMQHSPRDSREVAKVPALSALAVDTILTVAVVSAYSLALPQGVAHPQTALFQNAGI